MATKKKASANKTKPEMASVADFLATLDDDTRADCEKLVKLMRRVSGEKPVMWGASIVGFGKYHYKYPSGREGDFFLIGFSPRKANLTVYVMPGFSPYRTQLARLGKHKIAKSCLYLKGLEGIDLKVLEEIATDAVARMRKPR